VAELVQDLRCTSCADRLGPGLLGAGALRCVLHPLHVPETVTGGNDHLL
jgi:hypothetical protein